MSVANIAAPEMSPARSCPDPAETALVLVGPAEDWPSGLMAAAAASAVLSIRVHRDPDHVAGVGHINPQTASLDLWCAGPSPFGESDIDLVLRSNGIRSVILAGSDARQDLTCFAYDASRRGYRVLEACLADARPPEAAFLPWPRDTVAPDLLCMSWDAAEGTPRNWMAEVKSEKLTRSLAERLVPARTALLVIDVLNDFCRPGGVIDATKADTGAVQAAIPKIAGLLRAARQAGVHVAHVQAMYGPFFRSPGSPYRYPSNDTAEGAVWCSSAADLGQERLQFDASMVELCLPGSWGGAFVSEASPVPGESIVVKHRYSALADTSLERILRERGIETVVIAGVTTNCCVESTARDLSMADYNIVVAEDCVAVKDLVTHLHHASLEQIRTYFGVVTSSARVRDIWSGQ